jgi:multidrug efflux system membrane fusion protein
MNRFNYEQQQEASRKKIIYAALSVLGLILILVWMQGGFRHKTRPGHADLAENAVNAAMPSAQVVERDVDEMQSWPASVTSRDVAHVASRVAARIVALNVRTGDRVTAGQALGQLDDKEYGARLQQARSALAAAEAQAHRAAAEIRRSEILFEKEAVTQQMLEAAQAAAHTANAQVAEARAAAGVAASADAETQLRAPFDGVVVRRLMEPGDTAMPGSPVLLLQSLRRLRIEAALPESCGVSLKVGDRLWAQVGQNRYPVAIEEIAPAYDADTRTVLIKAGLDVPSVSASLQPGAFARLEKACGRHMGLFIPVSAVHRSGQLESVYLVEQGNEQLRHIRTGKIQGDSIEVLAGLKAGQTVSLNHGE